MPGTQSTPDPAFAAAFAACKMAARRIYWLGGSACAGKSTVAALLAQRFDLRLYRWDDHFEAHRRRARGEPGRWPAFEKVMDQSARALFSSPAEARAVELTAFYRDEFAMVLEDLARVPLERAILVEGAGVDPEALHALAVPRHRALWLLAPEPLRRQRYRDHRANEVAETLRECPDPTAAFAVWMARDEARRERTLSTTAAAGYRAWEVAEADTAESLTLRLARHYRLS
jgi:hypothetical protein